MRFRRRSFGAIWIGVKNIYTEDRCVFRPYCTGKIQKVEHSYDYMGNKIDVPNQYICDNCGATYYSNTEITGGDLESIARCSKVKPLDVEWKNWFARNGYVQVTTIFLKIFKRTKWAKKNAIRQKTKERNVSRSSKDIGSPSTPEGFSPF